MAQRALEVLSDEECFALLEQVSVGRLVYVDDLGPLAIPVNFTVVARDILFRVAGGEKQAAMDQPVLGFEADHLDEEHHSGWSVLVRGKGQAVDTEDVPWLLRGLEGQFPHPWAAGVHNVWLRITPLTVTGRRLGAEQPSLSF